MFEFLLPTAYAQGVVQNTEEATTEGLEGLIRYVVTNIDNWIAGIVIAVLFFLLSKMAARAFKKTIIQKKGEDVHEASLVLVERVTVITISIIGVTIAFAINGLNFTAVIGALSLGIGFALKDIIGNFISGVIMLSQNRIRIGDFIKVNDILGTIVSIDARATILQAIDGTEVVIPNQTMLGETLVSYSTNPFRRIELSVGVDYKTDLPMVTSLIKGILDKDPAIVPKPVPLILVDEFGDSSININIKFWVETGTSWLNVRSNLANKIKKAFDELGINIPFPIRTLKLDENDRSFLKTMDSMKKGFVPEEGGVPNMDQVRQSAENTAKNPAIPIDLFKGDASMPHMTDDTGNGHSQAADRVTAKAQVAQAVANVSASAPAPTPTAPSVVPVIPQTPATEQNQSSEPVPATVPVHVSDGPKAPPTHL